MARQARRKSQSGIYHIILRGINKQFIFEDDEDKMKFLECLMHYKGICQYMIYGYCLMDNHVHLLIKESEEDISAIMKRIGVRYVAWYNRKYNRCGHLFQDRFKSEVVENDEYLLVVLRYIHQNPLKAGLVQDLESYKSSSYIEYISNHQIIDADFILGLFSKNKDRAIKNFRQFMNERTGEVGCIEVDKKTMLTDEEVKMVIQQYANVSAPFELQAMEKKDRDERIRKIKLIQGISTRQIARLTGISQSVIARA
ncbi:hypothetical protein SCACP_37170 [Sporomusa carbonis]|uniref:transposase n=1 Tax=Sporomusa carbonis TaxID=3076075 RepID=UPI003A68B863